MQSKPMDGIALITAERKRQIEKEGFTTEYDTQHFEGELAYAAICYAYPNKRLILKRHDTQAPAVPTVELKDGPEGEGTYLVMPPSIWPFGLESWKPTPKDRIRELTKAGAMTAAEIDRLLRAKGILETSGIALITAERKRQIEKEGFTTEYDIHHFEGELAYGAICYAYPDKRLILKRHDTQAPAVPTVELKDGPEGEGTYLIMPPSIWPFGLENWKPTPDDRIRELIKAGAMFAAEIDRLLNSQEI